MSVRRVQGLETKQLPNYYNVGKRLAKFRVWDAEVKLRTPLTSPQGWGAAEFAPNAPLGELWGEEAYKENSRGSASA